jgi:uncharacterized protein YbaP (TraB family)
MRTIDVIKICLLPLLVLFMDPVVVRAQAPEGIFYQVSGGGLKQPSYLFGTFHLVNNGYLSGRPAVEKAFRQAQGVVVELVTDDQSMAAAASAGRLSGKTLTAFFEPSFQDSLDRELRAVLGAGLKDVEGLKPMLVSLSLSLTELMRERGAELQRYVGVPLDKWFATEGKGAGKKVTALETLEEQIAILYNSRSEEAQAEALKLYLRRKDEMKKLGSSLLDAWFAADLPRIWAIYNHTLELSGEEDYLVNARNLRWLKQLPELMKDRSQFIAVGALHLAGPNGLVTKLREQGYTVTPLKMTE